jgi:peptide/nickel transport system permease protein
VDLKTGDLVRFSIGRCLRAVLVLVTVSMLSFSLVDLAPGDYFDELRLNPRISKDTIDALRQQYGLEEPMPVRYANWVKSLVNGSWGFSLSHQRAAGPLIWDRAVNTLLLVAIALIITWTIAIPAAIWAAAGRQWRTRLLIGGASLAVSIPDLLIVLILSVAAANTSWLPAGGMRSVNFEQLGFRGQLADAAIHLVIPVAALVLSMLPVVSLHAINAVEDVLREPFILTARANGIRRIRILIRHALPVAANPLITLAGLSVGTMLSSAVIVEAVSGWPGLGDLLLQSIQQRDMHVVLGATMLSCMLLLASTLVSDILLRMIDPRIGSAS